MYKYQITKESCPSCGADLKWRGALTVDGHACYVEDGNIMQVTEVESGDYLYYLFLPKEHCDLDCRCGTCYTDLGEYLGHEMQD